jgi:hypothetical protein
MPGSIASIQKVLRSARQRPEPRHGKIHPPPRHQRPPSPQPARVRAPLSI